MLLLPLLPQVDLKLRNLIKQTENEGKVDKTEEMKETMKDSKDAKESDCAKGAKAFKTGIEAEFSEFKDELMTIFAGMFLESEGRISKELSKQINGLESQFKASVDSIRI